MKEKKKILVIFAHPVFHKSRVNKELLNAASSVDGVRINNLYEAYPDFFINIKREQELLVGHDIIIWHHPFYWYSSPAIIKEWMDLVLQHDFAYGKKGLALRDKWIFNVITTGGSMKAYTEDGYNHVTIRQLLLPFQQTAGLCNMVYLPPFVVHGTHLFNGTSIEEFASIYRKLLIGLRDNLINRDVLKDVRYMNDLEELKLKD